MSSYGPRYRSSTLRVCSLIVTVTSVACSDPITSMPSAEGEPRAEAISRAIGERVAEGHLWTIDDELDAMVDQVPGFGGFFFDTVSGAIVVQLQDPRNADVAQRGVEALLQRVSPVLVPRLANFRIQPARYSFRDLRQFAAEIRGVLPSAGVTLVDINEVENRIDVGVRDPRVGAGVTNAIARLGVPGGAVLVSVVAPFVTHVTLQQYSRPLLAGFQITAPGTCTLGHSIKKFVSGVNDGQRYYLTNSHCTSQFGVVDGDAIGQPTTANPFGVEILDPPLFTPAQNPACPATRLCRYSDAALFQIHTADTWTPGAIARTNTQSLTISGTPVPVTAEGYLGYPGLAFQKVGRTTGTTYGTMTAQCADVGQSVNIGGVIVDTGRTMLCQATATYLAMGGDSGSPVVLNTSTNRYGVGIHWGGNGSNSAVFSNKNYIENELAQQNGQITYSVLP